MEAQHLLAEEPILAKRKSEHTEKAEREKKENKILLQKLSG